MGFELESYVNATPAEKKSIQAAAIEAHARQLAGIVRSMLPARFSDAFYDGLQAARLGVIKALERFDPGRGVPFWPYARLWVRKELQDWLGTGVYWRKETNGGASLQRRAAREAAKVHRTPASLDAELAGTGEPMTRHDCLSDETDIEALVVDKELYERVKQFEATLTQKDKSILQSGGTSRQYLDLVERATAFLRGSNAHSGTLPTSTRRRSGLQRKVAG